MVEIVEVAPRDGLQNEPRTVSTSDKLAFIRALAGAGLRRIEVTSFVRPDLVPQLADAEELLRRLDLPPSVRVSALVLNAHGLRRALHARVHEVNLVVVSTDEFSRRNQGTTTELSIAAFRVLAKTAHDAGLFVTLTVAAAFGCPFEGEVSPERILDIIQQCTRAPVDEICLADTIGVATPGRVSTLVGQLRNTTDVPLRCHFHNTRNTGYANAFAAITAGASTLDASTGGIGGCPFAPNATGNIATEDLTWALTREGISTGIDLTRIRTASQLIERALGTPNPALLSHTPPFPPYGS